MIGYTTRGRGNKKVLVLHDWFSDCTSYETFVTHLDTQKFTFAFMDMRGYGRSKNIDGLGNIEEAANDAFALADHLKWHTFYVICHSMSALVTCQMLIQNHERVERVVAITPVPPCGSAVEDDILLFLETAASGHVTSALDIIRFITGHRLDENFVSEKVDHWFHCSRPEARITYLHSFTQTDLSHQIRGMATPILTLSGVHDAEAYGADMMKKTFACWFPNHTHKTLGGCGHFPMQEIPKVLALAIQNFFL
jgi:3-oxoadipate enol-lactonase